MTLLWLIQKTEYFSGRSASTKVLKIVGPTRKNLVQSNATSIPGDVSVVATETGMEGGEVESCGLLPDVPEETENEDEFANTQESDDYDDDDASREGMFEDEEEVGPEVEDEAVTKEENKKKNTLLTEAKALFDAATTLRP